MKFGIVKPENLSAVRTQALIVPVYAGDEDQAPRPSNELLKALSADARRHLKAILANGDFKAKPGEWLCLPQAAHFRAERLALVGLGASCGKGRALKCAVGNWRQALDKAFAQLGATSASNGVFVAYGVSVADYDRQWLLRQLLQAAVYASYRYRDTLSEPSEAPPLKRLDVACVDAGRGAGAAMAFGVAVANGANLARSLGDLPANICTPRYLAKEAGKLARRHPKLKLRVLDEPKLRALKMGALLSVSAGSAEPPRLLVFEYQGAGTGKAPLIFVGKGVTFDTGGISIKPAAAMDEMKYDMCGAASVFGVMRAAAEMKLPLNVVGIVGAVENMPGSRATKPGDVVTTMSGRTVEVLNTDAEGRLVLCDALHYARRWKPECMIDIATLTGACVVALGSHASGLMTNDDNLAERLLRAGESSGDRAWRLPLWEEYQKQLRSNFADLPNISAGREAGTITAACFLSHFVEDVDWAHLDIAGTAWRSGVRKGASGRPVPLLCEFLLQRAGLA